MFTDLMVEQAYNVGVVLAVGILGVVSIDQAVDGNFYTSLRVG